MFTECPECSTAFRVTAKVLQQAGGRVRCGGCGHAFSALDHLTEEMPGADLQADSPQADTAADDLTSDEKFRETSRQLLKTLSELAGPDEVRIEDTGIEWHVVDDEDDEEIEADAVPVDDASTYAEATDEDSGELLELEEDEQGSAAERTHTGAVPAETAFKLSDEEPTDLAVSDDEEWTDLLEDGDEDTVAGDDIPIEVEEELAAIHSELSAKDAPEPVDLDSQFELQAEAMGLEISGSHEAANEDDGLTTGQSRPSTGAATYLHPVQETESTDDDLTDMAPLEGAADEDEEEIAADGILAMLVSDDDEDQVTTADDADDDQEVIATSAASAEVIELSIEGAEGAVAQAPEYTTSHDVPEPSEEEMTINQEIDQELLAIADQDDDLAATIIGLENVKKVFEEDSQEVETIIMEGEQIRGAFEKERDRKRQEAALKRFDKAGNLIDSYITRRAIRGGRRFTDPPSYAVIGGAAVLLLLLAGQIVHANRESLSTNGLFNRTLGPIYRMLGNPVTPEWSIKGWQFEATNGSVAENQDVLTIYSRIGNRSEQPLPYPLVHVSLTDRWEEIIGSRVLEPSEYLAGDLNPGTPVIPGENFTAVITINEPSVDATGFKLNVCYRVSPGRVRCATEDFKD